MPIVESTYQARGIYKSGHYQTVYQTLVRKVPKPDYSRKRLALSDEDFVDIDYLLGGNDKIVVICHGLEGCSGTNYMKGMARHFSENQFDVAALNFRGCSGEPNRKVSSYHSGHTQDLRELISHIEQSGKYQAIYLVGFSLGGNVILKLLGELGSNAINKIAGAVCFSVPCDLAACAIELAKMSNWIYMKRFLIFLKQKLDLKKELFPDEVDISNFRKVRTFADFDGRYIAPYHGFKSAEDYWEKSSSKQFIPEIKVPTLLVSAQNDPFLADSCLPVKEAKGSEYFYLEPPKHGGHVGFVTGSKTYWSEHKALEFLSLT